MFEQVIRDYVEMEPGQSDAWNPLKKDYELAYRLSLFSCLTAALRKCEMPLASLSILDIGCGTGRSTRMYIDLGIYPEQLTGVDLREGAVALAARLNPAIKYKVIRTAKDAITDGQHQYNWIHTSTAFSSIRQVRERESFANEISDILSVGGYFFYYDLERANDFAGGDLINPRRLFSQLQPVLSLTVNEFPYVRLFKSLQEKSDTLNSGKKESKIKRIARVILNREIREADPQEICRKDVVLFRKNAML